MKSSYDVFLADLRGKLASVEAREDAEIEKVHAKYRGQKQSLSGTIELYEELDDGSADAAADARPDEVIEVEAEPRKPGRVPGGFYKDETLVFASGIGRVFHIDELKDHLVDQLRERFPDKPHMDISDKSMKNNVWRLFGEKQLIRVVFDNKARYSFYGLPEYMTEDMYGRHRFTSQKVGPPLLLLVGVKNLKPQFYTAPRQQKPR